MKLLRKGWLCLPIALSACSTPGGSTSDAVVDIPDASAPVDEPVGEPDSAPVDTPDASMPMDTSVVHPTDVPADVRSDTFVTPFADWTPDAFVIEVSITRQDMTNDHPLCEPDTSVTCICADGGAGRQVCTATGVWYWCDCGRP